MFRDLTIVDTAGFRNRTTINALVATDLAIIPLKPAREDVDGALAAYGLIQEINETPERAGRPIQVAMVLTMTMRATVIARHVRAQLTEGGYPQGLRMKSGRQVSPLTQTRSGRKMNEIRAVDDDFLV